MKTKLGIGLMILGSLLMALSLGLFLQNSREQRMASEAAQWMMPQIVEAIYDRQAFLPQTHPDNTVDESVPTVPSPGRDKSMPVVEIDGAPYVGFVAIPSLGLELPVAEDWSYQKLKKTPCRYSGDMYRDDLVIMAHNYSSHFKHIQDLRVGDTVTVTDMDGARVEYAVVALDILEPTAVEEMTSGEFDLTLFTCTYGGKSRVTVRCDRVND